MSFSRLNYDAGTYTHNLRQSVGAVDYHLNTPISDCVACFPKESTNTDRMATSRYGNAIVGEGSGEFIDISSELAGITRRATNNPLEKYIPDQNKNNTKHLHILKDCNFIQHENTRLSNPPYTLKSTGWNRWEWLCKNPQDKAFVPFDYLIDSRTISKDNHRPCLQYPVDQSYSLPPHNQDDKMYDAYKPCKSVNEQIPSVSYKQCDYYDNAGITTV